MTDDPAPPADPGTVPATTPDETAPPDGLDAGSTETPTAGGTVTEVATRTWARQRIHIAMGASALAALAALVAAAAPWWQLRSSDLPVCVQFSVANPCTGPPAGAHAIDSATYYLDQSSGAGAGAVVAIAIAALLLAGLIGLLLTGHSTWQRASVLAGAAAALLVFALATDPQPDTPFFVGQSGPGWGRVVCVIGVVLAAVAGVAAGNVPDTAPSSRPARAPAAAVGGD